MPANEVVASETEQIINEQIIQSKPLTARSPAGLPSFYSFTRESLAAYLKEQHGAASFHAQQIFRWVYKKGVRSFDEMTDLGESLRKKLSESIIFSELGFETRQISVDGTRKYLIKVGNDLVEAVMIKQPNRMTLCVSSQVGCGMGCKFCRTATMGFRRHLGVEEILKQVMTVKEDAKNFGDDFTNIVFMGMGEPFHNFENVSKTLKVLTDAHGLFLPPRKITVSTVGLVPKIDEFRELGAANLAVSLNATTDEVRSQIMPVNKAFPIEKLVGALRQYPYNKRRKITVEYVMLSGINDLDEDLQRLPKLLKGVPAKVNLIPYNDNAGLAINGTNLKSPSKERVHYWLKELSKHGLDVTVRWSKGADISAACGQLATEKQQAAAAL